MLSIIIPVYNVEAYLRECLDSVFAQDLTGCEVICVDDGSTDGSSIILEEYVARYHQFLRVVSQPNSGLSEARNAGVREARGNYYYFVDSDDFLLAGAIAEIKRAILGYPTVDVFHFDNLQADSGERLTLAQKGLPMMGFLEYYEVCYLDACKNNISLNPTAYSFVFSANSWQKNHFSFDKGLRYEDRMFLYRMLVKEGTIKVIHTKEPFYVARQARPGSITNTVSVQHYLDRKYIIGESIRLFREKGIIDARWYEPQLSFLQWLIVEATEKKMVDQLAGIISREFVRSLQVGICSKESRKIWLLALFGIHTSALYYSNAIMPAKRKLINRFFSTIDTYCPDWLIRK